MQTGFDKSRAGPSMSGSVQTQGARALTRAITVAIGGHGIASLFLSQRFAPASSRLFMMGGGLKIHYYIGQFGRVVLLKWLKHFWRQATTQTRRIGSIAAVAVSAHHSSLPSVADTSTLPEGS